MDNVTRVLEIAVVVVGLAAFAWAVWQRSLVDVQKQALDAYETRMNQLEADVVSLKTENAELRGMVQGKRESMVDLVSAIAEANVCLAPSCPNRIVPSA